MLSFLFLLLASKCFLLLGYQEAINKYYTINIYKNIILNKYVEIISLYRILFNFSTL